MPRLFLLKFTFYYLNSKGNAYKKSCQGYFDSPKGGGIGGHILVIKEGEGEN